MIENERETLDDIDSLQRSIKRIVQGYIEQIRRLQFEIKSKEAENENLLGQNKEILDKLKNYRRRLEICKCGTAKSSSLLNEMKKKSDPFEEYQDDILKEVEEISSLELESQFVSDSDTRANTIAQVCPGVKVNSKNVFACSNNTNSHDSHTTFVDQPTKAPSQSLIDVVLVEDSPYKQLGLPSSRFIVPESVPQTFNETTPRKIDERHCVISDKIKDGNDQIVFENATPTSSPVIKLTPSDKLFGERKVAGFNISQLISPSRRLYDGFSNINEDETPKRKLFSSRSQNSPKRRKKMSSLRKSNRIEAELSFNGVRKLTQTQLNIACFKKNKTEENMDITSAGHLQSPLPVKQEPLDITMDVSVSERQEKTIHSTPLTSMENSPDMNETNLTASAIRKVAVDVAMDPVSSRESKLLGKNSLKSYAGSTEYMKKYADDDKKKERVNSEECFWSHHVPKTLVNNREKEFENSPDLNETNLSESAANKIARNSANDVKPTLHSSYDRIPQALSLEGKKAIRKRLPGLECPDCIKYYEMFGAGNEELKKSFLDRCSRHRTKNVPLNNTPEGFWKPIITQTPR